MVIDYSQISFGEDSTLRDRIFNEEVDFSGAEIKDNAILSHSTFTRDVTFKNTIFHGDFDCFQTSFKGKADFSQATFNRGVDFLTTSFEKEVNFKDAYFGDRANFQESSFKDNVDFSKSIFENLSYGDHNFRGVRFSDDVRFTKVKFKEEVKFDTPNDSAVMETRFNSGAYFTNAFFIDANFSNATFVGPVSFRGTSFERVPIFHDTHFSKRPDWIGSKLGSLDMEIPEWTEKMATIATVSGFSGKTLIDMTSFAKDDVENIWMAHSRQNEDFADRLSNEALEFIKEIAGPSEYNSITQE